MPTNPKAGFSVGASVSMWGTAGQNVSFENDISVYPNTDAYRLYERKPGSTSFTLVGEFNDLSALTCGQYRVSGAWGLTPICGGVGRQWVAQRMNPQGTQSGLYPASFYSVGAHSYYVTAVDSGGNEGSGSAITSMNFLGPITILSPTEAESPTSPTPTFRWSDVSVWPTGMWTGTGPYNISIAQEGSKTIDCPHIG